MIRKIFGRRWIDWASPIQEKKGGGKLNLAGQARVL
jgi:hypothetical protein